MQPLLIILGPTASGKTNLATRICKHLDGELISADSRQIYRNMDIGTGKDLEEYNLDGYQVPYHLINIQDAGTQYNVNEFQKDFKMAYDQIEGRKKTTVVCGGTGFYLHSILSGYAYSAIPVNEVLRNELQPLDPTELLNLFKQYTTPYSTIADVSTKKRLIRAIEISAFLESNPEKKIAWAEAKEGYPAVIYGLNPPVEVRRERISKRLRQRLESGMVEEVQALLNNGLHADQLIYYGLEYKYITLYLTGQITYPDMVVKLETEIHRFAKRQMTFFRKMEKDGMHIHWLDTNKNVDQQVEYVAKDYIEQLTNFN